MIALPTCVVQTGVGPWLPTDNGVNVDPNVLVSIKLASSAGVSEWYVKVLGTDELMSFPVINGADAVTGKVPSPSGIVSFTIGGVGSAVVIESTIVTGAIQPLSTSFGVYVPTVSGYRVGAAGERVEGDAVHGWASKINPLIRAFGKPVGANTLTSAYTCQPTVNLYDAVYLSGDDTVDKASAADILTMPALGVVVDRPNPTTAVVAYGGDVLGLVGLQVGKVYYVDTVAGNLTVTAPTAAGSYLQPIARAVTSSRLVVNPSSTMVQIR